MKRKIVCSVIVQAFLLMGSSLLTAASDDHDTYLRALGGGSQDFADCNGCFCVPDEGGPCPDQLKPQTDWSALMPILKSFELTNPPSLDCNPYEDASCTPPSSQAEGVCVVEISPSSTSTCPNDYTYTLKTYEETVDVALANGRLVTHSNPCGVCSSLQDLAAYMNEGANLRNAAQNCGIRGILGERPGTKCFMDLGFTEPCAKMWYYNSLHTRKKCRWTCWKFYLFHKDPNTGPSCDLASCIECDEEESGPLFDVFAGRTRRNSGLLSNIVRPCSQMQVLPQLDPCELYSS